MKPSAAAVAMILLATGCGGRQEPDPAASPLGGRLSQGEARVRVRGDVRTEFVAPLDPDAPNIFQPPDGGFALNWSDETAQGFGVGGPLFTGSRPTGEDLSLSITTVEGGLPSVFGSFAGECRITIAAVGGELLSGTFECTDLTRGALTIDAEGDFEARA